MHLICLSGIREIRDKLEAQLDQFGPIRYILTNIPMAIT
jgi:hypothetical protein